MGDPTFGDEVVNSAKMCRCARQTVMIVMTITNSSGLSSCTRPRHGFMHIQHGLTV